MLWWFAQDFFIAAALAALVALMCLRWRLDPVARHALWLVVLIKLVTPPLVAWPWAIPKLPDPSHAPPAYSAEASSSKDIAEGKETSAAPVLSATEGAVDIHIQPTFTDPIVPAPKLAAESDVPSPPPQVAVKKPEPIRSNWRARVLRTVTGIWLAGSIGFAGLQGLRILRMMLRLRRALPAEAALIDRVAALAARLRMRTIPVRIVAGIGSPAIWAVARPKLLWPAELPADLPPRAIDGLIVHELAHARRCDHWVGWLELLAGCVWWWNPLFWYVRHQIRENAELACDAWVVEKIPTGRRAYAEALLAVCESLSGRPAPMPAVGAHTGGRRFLERRLAMILREHFPLRLRSFRLVAPVLLALISLPAWSQRAPQSGRDFEIDVEGTGFVNRLTIDSPIPPEAGALLDALKKKQEAAREQFEARLAKERQPVIQKLKAMAAAAEQNGSVDQAQAIRRAIAELQPPAAAGAPLPDPGTLVQYRGQTGKSYVFEVTGQTNGTIWGAGIYTDDSPLATAAVHAGTLRPGQTGIVRVTIQPALTSYEGTSQNGVQSSPYGAWSGSYTVGPVRAEHGERISIIGELPDRIDAIIEPNLGGGLHSYRDGSDLVSSNLPIGTQYTVEIAGSTSGRVWGNGIYTTDSSLSAAAVHAGALRSGEKGFVTVTILPGQESYESATRNGVSSLAWGEWRSSFVVQKTARKEPAIPGGKSGRTGGGWAPILDNETAKPQSAPDPVPAPAATPGEPVAPTPAPPLPGAAR